MNKTIANPILQFRTRNGLTQQEMASMVKTTRQAIIRWESGELPNPQNLMSLADVMGINPVDLEGELKNVAESS